MKLFLSGRLEKQQRSDVQLSESGQNKPNLDCFYHFPNQFYFKRKSVWFQIIRKMVITFEIYLDYEQSEKYSSVCRATLFLLYALKSLVRKILL